MKRAPIVNLWLPCTCTLMHTWAHTCEHVHVCVYVYHAHRYKQNCYFVNAQGVCCVSESAEKQKQQNTHTMSRLAVLWKLTGSKICTWQAEGLREMLL